MPVIGRLDGQVEEVIINPVARRTRDEEPPPELENAEAPRPPDPAPSHTPPAGESSASPGELPVWLL